MDPEPKWKTCRKKVNAELLGENIRENRSDLEVQNQKYAP